MRFFFSFLACLIALPAIAAPTVFKVDPAASKVGWLAKKLAGQHNGTLNLKSGSLQFDGDNLKGGEFTVDMRSIKVLDVQDAKNNKDLTEHLNSDDFFGTKNFGEAVFTIQSVKKNDKGVYEATGPMVIKGKPNDVTVPLKIEKKGEVVTATGVAKLDRTKWDIKYRSPRFVPNIGDKLIYDEFEIDVNLTAKK